VRRDLGFVARAYRSLAPSGRCVLRLLRTCRLPVRAAGTCVRGRVAVDAVGAGDPRSQCSPIGGGEACEVLAQFIARHLVWVRRSAQSLARCTAAD